MRLSGHMICQVAGISRSRLSDIERGYVQPSIAEMQRLETALNKLLRAKRAMEVTAAEVGWPLSAL